MKIPAKTKICCIIGDPINHSLSPVMHNAGYEALHLDYHYVPFPVRDIEQAVKAIRSLHIQGVSVTIPHKIKVMQYLDEIDKKTQTIGAVNTIINRNGKLTGTNTDANAAIKALREVTNIKNKKIIIVGAGGAARAITYSLKTGGANVLIINRTFDKAKKIAQELNVAYGDLSKLNELRKSDILIHATAVGTHPKENETIIPTEYLHKNLTVFDIVYNPKETRLIKDAQKAGCRTIYGYKMLLYQAAEQFKLFTHHDGPIKIMEQTLLNHLERK